VVTPMDIEMAMRTAIDAADAVRGLTSPNPWVGAVLIDAAGDVISSGATQPPGGPHAEVVALDRASGADLTEAVLIVTLEPCGHHGRTPPCVDRILTSGIRRVVVGITDPDPRVSGAGVDSLRAAGVHVDLGVLADQVTEQLWAYLHHRRTGRPYVVLKMAATLDGRVAAPDGDSVWITGAEARADVHRLRAHSDVVIVGSGTVSSDDPLLTVRDVAGPSPRRVVLGAVPAQARIRPCEEFSGDPEELFARLGEQGAVQVLVEGGANVAGQLHARGLIDRYVIYFAPALFGGNSARALLDGPTAPTMQELWRGELVSVERFGDDVRLDIVPRHTAHDGDVGNG